MDVIAFADEFATSGMARRLAQEILATQVDTFVRDTLREELANASGVDPNEIDLANWRPKEGALKSIKDEAWQAIRDQFSIGEAATDFFAAIRRADEVVAGAAVVAPSAVGAAAQKLATMTKAMASADTTNDVTYEDWRQARQRFIELARQDLRVKGDPPPLEE